MATRLRYVFMGTPEFAAVILQRIATTLGPPTLVVTQPARHSGRGQKINMTAVASLSQAAKWDCISPESVNDETTIARLQACAPDLIIVAAFGQILKRPLLELPTKYCLNVHASLLPKYRGAAPVARAILAAEAYTGISIQKMERKLDTGDVLMQREIDISDTDTAETLLSKLAVLGGDCIIESVDKISAGEEIFTPQVEELATYAAKLSKSESEIDWVEPADRVLRKIYGLQPWPVAQTHFEGQAIKIFAATLCQTERGRLAPGSVQTDHRSFLNVVCGDGRVLSLTEVQLRDRKRVSVAGFLSAYRGRLPFTRFGNG